MTHVFCSIYFDIFSLFSALELLFELARDPIVCTFSQVDFDLSCFLVPAYKISNFVKFDHLAWTIYCAVLKFVHRVVLKEVSINKDSI